MIIELACSLFILLINEGCGFLFQAFCLSWGGISDIEKFRGVPNKAIKRGVLTKKEVRYYKNIIKYYHAIIKQTAKLTQKKKGSETWRGY
ncbi:hypothetical protein ACP2W0_18270 [Pseudobacillus badius]|uniref:hypothetical protein n=1 Tax=Bacillus badius TaxID=1455 RepID=UPI003CF9247C